MENKIFLSDCLDEIFSKINKNENFTLMRFGDGERSLILGKPVFAQEGWIAPEKVTSLGKALEESLLLEDDRIIIGISCPCCDRNSYYWYMTRVKNKNITFANIFVNINYYRFLEKFNQIKREAIVIGNNAGLDRRIGNLNVLKYYPIGDQCVEQWEEEGSDLINKIITDYGDQNDLLYVFAAGPLSEPIISALFKNNPNNCYVDFGSSIDKFIHQKDTRPYTDPKSIFGSRNCWMYDPRKTSFDVSVILTTYKKPDALEKQLNAIKAQSLKPKEILLFQDGIDGQYAIRFKDQLLQEFDNVIICEKNTGVWRRFDFARGSKSQYVCLFDDDTIPGPRWLENCHSNMMEQEGVYGTIGIVVKNYKKYPYSGFYRVGWLRPYTKKAEVDFVGHSWFVKKEYLDFMFEDTDKYQKFTRAAEDMCLSYKCQMHGIRTFVPPHPYFDYSLWGSQPDTGLLFGKASAAISQNYDNCMYMRKALSMLVDDGWKFYFNRNKRLSGKVEIGIKIEQVMMLMIRTKNMADKIIKRLNNKNN